MTYSAFPASLADFLSIFVEWPALIAMVTLCVAVFFAEKLAWWTLVSREVRDGWRLTRPRLRRALRFGSLIAWSAVGVYLIGLAAGKYPGLVQAMLPTSEATDWLLFCLTVGEVYGNIALPTAIARGVRSWFGGDRRGPVGYAEDELASEGFFPDYLP